MPVAILPNQMVLTKLGYCPHDILYPRTDSVGFWISGEIILRDQPVQVAKEPNGPWREASIPAGAPHPEFCLCDQCSRDYYAMTGEIG